jgi:hypothetical protein
VSSGSSREREIREISIAANCGEASEEQIARLDQLVGEDPQLASYAARMLDQQASLAWQGSLRDGPAEASCDLTARVIAQSDNHASEQATAPRRLAIANWNWPTIAVGIAFIAGVLASQLLRSPLWSNSSPPISGIAFDQQSARPLYEARLVGSTACLWDSNSAGSREIGSWLSSGESLHLLEGLAEFTLTWSRSGSANLSLEGPAAMMLTSEGMPTLRFGRLTATINTSFRPFVLETPIGRLVVSRFGSIGASAFGNDGEIHVFDGTATLEPAWRTSTGQENELVTIRTGEAIHVQEDATGELIITRHPSDKDYFVAQLSMNSDPLTIPPAYVAAVKKAAPIAYWRFERDAWPRIPNQMGSRFECHVEGALGVAAYHANQAVEFGVTDQGGDILCNDLLNDEIQGNYSIEFWIKPSHYHVGAVVSLVGDPDTPNGIVPHGLLLELGGTGLIPTSNHHPGRIRFLHRSPASNDSQSGTSCYSTAAYTLRKWQHIVAVKDAAKMLLYVNGERVSEGEDATTLPKNMRLVAGKLYPGRRIRPLIGQLDELAIYNRSLEQKQIKRHYQLVRPPRAASEPSI